MFVEQDWYAARPSGTEDVHERYAEGFIGKSEYLKHMDLKARARLLRRCARLCSQDYHYLVSPVRHHLLTKLQLGVGMNYEQEGQISHSKGVDLI